MLSNHLSDMSFSEGERRKHTRMLRSLENVETKELKIFEPRPFTKWIVCLRTSVMASVAGLRNADRSLEVSTI